MQHIVGVMGASGRTGRLVVDEALRKNFRVRALVRKLGALDIPSSNLEIVVGDPADGHVLLDFCAGLDALVCTIGARRNAPSRICSVATQHAIHAMQVHHVSRLVVVSGAMIGHPRLGLFYRTLARFAVDEAEMEDRRTQERMVQNSGLEWTLLRPTRLRDGDASKHVLTNNDVHVRMLDSVSRSDLARVCVRAVEGEWKKQAVLLRS